METGGDAESLTIDYHIGSRFDTPAAAALRFHLSDAHGNTIRQSKGERVARRLGREETAERSYSTPNNLADGHYRLEALAVPEADALLGLLRDVE